MGKSTIVLLLLFTSQKILLESSLEYESSNAFAKVYTLHYFLLKSRMKIRNKFSATSTCENIIKLFYHTCAIYLMGRKHNYVIKVVF